MSRYVVIRIVLNAQCFNTLSPLRAMFLQQGYTPEEIAARCDIVDRRNAMMSRTSAFKYASQIVTSGAS